ncbi:Brp/Blh family beta-carotene 15,15'-dioxygenase [Acidithiobacillus sp.]|uniref:Brp/Blh family beta-carotene 15,15'-dioxygenase n=1 Tax=Acidithiobacillus sp. TaxID=1872118 RepID=UPI0025C07B0A|nr:Brp/Blh family beta-carotene 15,15'-dioxygenase [Acidithiobacillus sp.]
MNARTHSTAASSFATETWVFLALGSGVVAWYTLVMQTGTADIGTWLVLFLAVAVALFGLPHGALDPWVARRAELWHTPTGCVVFHLAYVALVLLVIWAWRAAPTAALVVFLGVSAWHFGSDWRPSLHSLPRFGAGIAMLGLPAWRWPGQIDAAFGMLAGAGGQALAHILTAAGPFFLVALLTVALLALGRGPRTAAAELGGVTALALLLPPLWFFLVYFCALHSLRHLRLVTEAVPSDRRPRLAAMALGYTALTVVGAALAWPWLAGLPVQAAGSEGLLRVVFIGLAAVTLPHVLVVEYAENHTPA